jgi:hypothetical protein
MSNIEVNAMLVWFCWQALRSPQSTIHGNSPVWCCEKGSGRWIGGKTNTNIEQGIKPNSYWDTEI